MARGGGAASVGRFSSAPSASSSPGAIGRCGRLRALDRPKHARPYNERLFSGGIRSYFHFARFLWVQKQIRRLGIYPRSVLELGCYDGRLLSFIPKPERYVGVDANWENGLDLARAKYGERYEFLDAQTPSDMTGISGRFDLAACLETLEHVPPEHVDGYLSEIARRLNGYLLITVPNETGPLFLAKWLAKAVFRMSPKDYTVAELFYATICRTEKIRRLEHKGFNYRDMVRQIGKHFDVLYIQGFPMGSLPTSLCFGVGITARSRQ